MNRLARSLVLSLVLFAVSVSGCAWLRKAEPQIVHAVDTGCQVVNMLAPDPLLGTICIALGDLGRLFDVLAKASFRGESVTLRYVAPDGAFRDVVIPIEEVSHAAVSVRSAMYRAGLK